MLREFLRVLCPKLSFMFSHWAIVPRLWKNDDYNRFVSNIVWQYVSPIVTSKDDGGKKAESESKSPFVLSSKHALFSSRVTIEQMRLTFANAVHKHLQKHHKF